MPGPNISFPLIYSYQVPGIHVLAAGHKPQVIDHTETVLIVYATAAAPALVFGTTAVHVHDVFFVFDLLYYPDSHDTHDRHRQQQQQQQTVNTPEHNALTAAPSERHLPVASDTRCGFRLLRTKPV